LLSAAKIVFDAEIAAEDCVVFSKSAFAAEIVLSVANQLSL
jgi:hypothetical protein